MATLNRQPSDDWVLIPRRDPQARVRLICLPSAGSGAAQYVPWSRLLPAEIQLGAIQLPGRESRLRERPYDRLHALADEIAGALAPCLDMPFAFFGHSMGALIAFEVARRLRREHGLEPMHLFLSARRAAHLPDPEPMIHHLPTPVLLQALIERYNGVPEVVLRDRELLELYLPVLRADITVVETYQYEDDEPFHCPISALGGLNDQRATAEELAAWQEHTTVPLSLQMFPGDHFFIQPHRAAVLGIIAEALCQRSVA